MEMAVRMLSRILGIQNQGLHVLPHMWMMKNNNILKNRKDVTREGKGELRRGSEGK